MSVTGHEIARQDWERAVRKRFAKLPDPLSLQEAVQGQPWLGEDVLKRRDRRKALGIRAMRIRGKLSFRRDNLVQAVLKTMEDADV